MDADQPQGAVYRNDRDRRGQAPSGSQQGPGEGVENAQNVELKHVRDEKDERNGGSPGNQGQKGPNHHLRSSLWDADGPAPPHEEASQLHGAQRD